MAEPETIKVRVAEESVTALLYAAPKRVRKGITLILGHGAGGNQLSPFLRMFGGGLAERGIDTVTFNFVYSEKGRGGPDQKPKLEACYLAVINSVLKHRKLKSNQLAVGGKSMGGRIGSQVVAALETSELSLAPRKESSESKSKTDNGSDGSAIFALVFLGYPLHPPGKPDQLRDAHLKNISVSMLFVQGTKDPFATPDELRAVIKKHKLAATLHLIEGGDHSLKASRNAQLASQKMESIMDSITDWLVSVQ